MKSKIFAVPVLDRWLLYAPLHDLSALVNAAAIKRLCRGGADLPADLHLLREKLLVEMQGPQPLSGDIAPEFLGFITTRACNIGCIYCDFGGPTAKKVDIDPEVVVSAIDWMADRLVASGRRRFQVHLFGGEPFHAPQMVDLIVHRTRAVCAARGLTPWFEVSTNGVFNEARARFVADYIDGVVLSFDGPPEFHNKNRPGFGGQPTYDIVYRTAKRLSKSSLELCLRSCITADSVSHMEEITEWMLREFQPALITHEPLTENELTRNAGLRAPDPYQFAVHWMNSYRLARKKGIKLVYSATENDRPRLSSCPVGTDTIIVSPNGRASACYLLPEEWQKHDMNMDVGWVRPGGKTDFDELAVHEVRNLITDKPRCEKCFCQWDCAGGCHVSHSYKNCETAYNAFCLQTRLITASLLLERLGAADYADRLLKDRAAMERLAVHPWDCIELETEFHEYRDAPLAAEAVPACT
jgi:uncharacterized protein